MTSVAYVGPIEFEQTPWLSMDARCQSCDWVQPWDGRNMLDHAREHGVELGDQCVECAVATLDMGLPTRCDEHAEIEP